jgi:hypothetical protein
MMAPSYYTESEGGAWIPWPQGFVIDEADYEERDWLYCRFSCGTRTLSVHSLAFGEPVGEFERWDCINGWTCKRA